MPKILKMFDTNLVLLGHSDGASISLIYAGGNNEKRLKGLILMAPHVYPENVCLNSITYAKKRYYEDDSYRTKIAKYHSNVDVAFKGWCDAWLDPEFLDWNIERYLENISVPALIIQGEDDEYGTLAQVEAVSTQIRNDRSISILPNCKHSPYLDQPLLTLNAIRIFLNKLT